MQFQSAKKYKHLEIIIYSFLSFIINQFFCRYHFNQSSFLLTLLRINFETECKIKARLKLTGLIDTQTKIFEYMFNRVKKYH